VVPNILISLDPSGSIGGLVYREHAGASEIVGSTNGGEVPAAGVVAEIIT